jgi:hypothetical protein
MNIDPTDEKGKSYILRRSILDYGRGGIILCFGVFLLIAEKIGFEFTMKPVLRYLLGGVFIIYGAFRIYTGYKKNYFSE